jgi:hypothetical protein
MLLLSFALLGVSTHAKAEEPVSGFNWHHWAQALNDSPCNWFNTEQWQQLLGADYQAQASTSKDATRCQFSNSAQPPLLTISIRSLANAAAVNAERDGMLQQINQYGSGRFEQLPTSQQAVTAILRKDKLQLFIFANNNNETAYILLSGHPIRTDSAEQKALRKTRVMQTAEQIFNHFGF